jgi:diaminopimelate epimerase
LRERWRGAVQEGACDCRGRLDARALVLQHRIAFTAGSAIYDSMGSALNMRFRKMNGLANEIVVVDLRGSGRVLREDEARLIAAQPRSHFDQLMALHDPVSDGTDAFVRIYNSDGSPAGACGNGTRCIGWIVAQETGRKHIKFETSAGILDVQVESMDRITVDMGEPRFGWAEIPLAHPVADTLGIDLQIGPVDRPVLSRPSVVNVGNPHAVFWVDDVEAVDLARFGPLLERHPIFPDRANISLARVTGPHSIRVRTWERGAGLTRACGSAACAVLVCAARTGRSERRAEVTLPGGTLEVEWTASNRILMTGPAAFEYEGLLSA